MAQYTVTIDTTFSNLSSSLSSTIESCNIHIVDPENIVIDNSSNSGSLGYILKSNIKQGILFDFTPTETEKASVTNLSHAFEGCSNLYAFGPFPETKLTNAEALFKDCTSLVSVDIDALTYIQDASYMFKNCSSLPSIKVNDLIDVIETDEMFSGCTSLVSIDISMFQNVTNALSMFSGDTSLTSITVSQGFLTELNSSSGMLAGCTSLSKINKDDPAKVDRHLYVRGNTEINGALRVSDASEKGGAIVRGTLQVDDIEILSKLGMIQNSYHSEVSDTSSKTVGKLTIRNGENVTEFDGSSDSTATITMGSLSYSFSTNTTNVYSNNVGTLSYNGSVHIENKIYEPNQDVNTTASPMFQSITSNLIGNASSSDKVNSKLSIVKALSSDTEYDGSIAKSVYSPGQLLETSSSPSFNVVSASLNGNASSANKVNNSLSISRSLSSDTSYDGSSAKSIYSPGQLVETTSIPTFNGLLLTGVSLSLSSTLSGADLSECWAKQYGNILRVHLQMPISSQRIYNNASVLQISGITSSFAVSPIRMEVSVDTSSSRYSAHLDISANGGVTIYFNNKSISSSVPYVTVIYGDSMITMN